MRCSMVWLYILRYHVYGCFSTALPKVAPRLLFPPTFATSVLPRSLLGFLHRVTTRSRGIFHHHHMIHELLLLFSAQLY